ncbi:MAG: glycosyl hydrolase 53 family protein [Sphingobacteriia bacterium]|nr:glycosyl hydrolase 53 family protein [Sphingobacteriia bacterium]
MKTILLYISLIACYACSKNSTAQQAGNAAGNYVKGADISWVTQMEASGIKFYDNNGVQQDCFALMKSVGMNAIRLRVWVNPTDGWCNTSDVVAKAIRAKNAGMKILLDFHYSDWWADPGKQNKPASWASQTISQLQASIYNHTQSVLQAMQAQNVLPDWVQVGNEVDNGMLWPDGQASINMPNFASFIQSGYNAVKAINNNIQVIVHVSNGYNNDLFRWIFDGLKANNTNWDIIGMSLYPSVSDWQTKNTQCLNNMNDMVARYGKKVMICEVGMPWDQAQTCKSFISDLIAKNKSLPNNMGIGVFYWEPECYNNWQGYTLGAFDNTGKPTAALDAFK